MAHILVVDDDELLGETVRAILESEGHAVGYVSSGEAAIETIALKRPDLIILDAMMPGIPGEEVLRRVRASDGSYRTPVLMLTARRNESDVQIAMRAGADDYLKKPFDPDRLLAHVDILLESGRKRVV
ncbi:MAG TPA: response regulator transcription factor [Allosphingosinicella sp.]|uniref:response regulator transcription factor n=1 Tax=Allosphingosinicella sp. TaxID=2823234 RepID=UPI002ED85FF4